MTCYFVVGRYRKKGNWGHLNDYNKNVPKGSFTRTVCSSLDDMVKEIESSVGDGGETTAGAASGGTTGGSTTTASGSNGSGATSDGGAMSAAGISGTANQQAALMLHNIFRKIHGTPEMKLNAKMNEEAQAYADVLLARQTTDIEHSSQRRDGENLAYDCFDKNADAVTATKAWFV